MAAIADSKPDVHRVYMYRRKEGSQETESVIVDIHTAAHSLQRQGWELTPYNFLPEESRTHQAEIVINELCQCFNGLLNMHLEKSKREVARLFERFLNYSPNPKMSRRAMVRKVERVARKQGKWSEDNFAVAVFEDEGAPN